MLLPLYLYYLFQVTLYDTKPSQSIIGIICMAPMEAQTNKAHFLKERNNGTLRTVKTLLHASWDGETFVCNFTAELAHIKMRGKIEPLFRHSSSGKRKTNVDSLNCLQKSFKCLCSYFHISFSILSKNEKKKFGSRVKQA